MTWIGVDFDGTLIRSFSAPAGEPLMPMVNHVRAMLARGYDVRIFSNRALETIPGDRAFVEAFCESYFGRKLPLTASKDHECVLIYDDIAVHVERDRGTGITGTLFAMP